MPGVPGDAAAANKPEKSMNQLLADTESGTGTDFILRAGKRSTHCHRHVLESKSPFLREIMDATRNEYSLGDDSAMAASGILRKVKIYLYTGIAYVTEDIAEAMLRAAAEIDCVGLTEDIQTYLKQRINRNNHGRFNELATQFELDKLQDACEKFANGYSVRVKTSERDMNDRADRPMVPR